MPNTASPNMTPGAGPSPPLTPHHDIHENPRPEDPEDTPPGMSATPPDTKEVENTQTTGQHDPSKISRPSSGPNAGHPGVAH